MLHIFFTFFQYSNSKAVKSQLKMNKLPVMVVVHLMHLESTHEVNRQINTLDLGYKDVKP